MDSQVYVPMFEMTAEMLFGEPEQDDQFDESLFEREEMDAQ